MSTFSFTNVTHINLLLNKHTHRMKIIYSRNFCALIRQLANYVHLVSAAACWLYVYS